MKDKINTILGAYDLALITEDFIYYVNFQECDMNGSTKMFNKDFKMISDNYFGTESFMDDMESVVKGELKPEFVHEEALHNMKEYLAQTE